MSTPLCIFIVSVAHLITLLHQLCGEQQQKAPSTLWIQQRQPSRALPHPEQWAEKYVYTGTHRTEGSAEFLWTLTVTACSGHPQPRFEATQSNYLLRLTLPTDEKVYHTVVEKMMHHSPIQHQRRTCDKDAPIEHIIRLEDPTHHTRLYTMKATLKHKEGCGPSTRDFRIAMDVNQTIISVRFQRQKHTTSIGWW